MWSEHQSHDADQSGLLGPFTAPGGHDLPAGTEEKSGRVPALTPQCAILAHELRGPLSVLSANIEVIEERAGTFPEMAAKWLRDSLAMQQRAVTQLQQLLNTLLEAFRLESGPRELRRESFDMCELVREVVHMQAEPLRAAGCACTMVGTEPVMGAWDRVRVSIAISNLLDNARKYGRGRPIEVRVGSDNAGVWVRVRDHGVGIDPADRQRIFEPFIRVKNAPAASGFGLGLWLVRSIALAHGGSVQVDGSIGSGTSFELHLPYLA